MVVSDMFLMFIPTWGRFPFWLYNIFANGLKPPTSNRFSGIINDQHRHHFCHSQPLPCKLLSVFMQSIPTEYIQYILIGSPSINHLFSPTYFEEQNHHVKQEGWCEWFHGLVICWGLHLNSLNGLQIFFDKGSHQLGYKSIPSSHGIFAVLQ